MSRPSAKHSSHLSAMNLKDWDDVSALLGREPRCGFEVVVRNAAGAPRVIRNDPLLYDGTPMPTRYWLVAPEDCLQVARLESEGGIKQAEAAVDAQALALAHARYAADRDATLPYGHDGPRPSGGVGGCRKGVKCLHAHYAWMLADGDDPVGKWMLTKLGGDNDKAGQESGNRLDHELATDNRAGRQGGKKNAS